MVCDDIQSVGGVLGIAVDLAAYFADLISDALVGFSLLAVHNGDHVFGLLILSFILLPGVLAFFLKTKRALSDSHRYLGSVSFMKQSFL
jgi:hypothetical protein